MKMYITHTSPYARLSRMVVIEKGLEDQVEIIAAQTRIEDSPYYDINPSGRVPYLVLDDGTGLEESALVCYYLDHYKSAPTMFPQDEGAVFQVKRLEAIARSMLDGMSVWGRELAYRPPELRSDFIIRHETARAFRMCDVFEDEVENPVMTGLVNMAQLTLACVFRGGDNQPDEFNWRDGRPKLAAWVDRIGDRASVANTLPPPPKH